MVVDLRTKLNFPVIHDASPDDRIDLLAAHRLLERMAEIMPSSDLVPCDNNFEARVREVPEQCDRCHTLLEAAQPFGFAIDYTDGAMNLRSYYPDFVAVDDKGTRWLLETKGAETEDVAHKDIAAAQWCANATQLTGMKWEYLKVPQKGFETLQPSRLEHLIALKPGVPFEP